LAKAAANHIAACSVAKEPAGSFVNNVAILTRLGKDASILPEQTVKKHECKRPHPLKGNNS
jgi:hypothetical protein